MGMATLIRRRFPATLVVLLYGFTVLTRMSTAGPATVTNGFLGGNFLGGLVCEFTDCGNGKCKATTKGLAGFECECDPGWKTHKAAPYTFPACILPNCSVDLGCDKASPVPTAALASVLSSEANNATLCPECEIKPSPQPASSAPTPTTTSAPTPTTTSVPTPSSKPDDHDACHMIWCGAGKCKPNDNGSGYHCQCHHGANNMFNNASWACFKPCSLGSDCYTIPTCPQDLRSPTPPPAAAPPPNNEAKKTHLSSLVRLPAVVLLSCILQMWL